MVNRRKLKLMVLAYMLFESVEENERRFWVHDFYKSGRSHGEYFTVFRQLKDNMHIDGYSEKFFEYTRMDLASWTKLLYTVYDRFKSSYFHSNLKLY